MSRNAAGTYTAPSNSVNPAVEGTPIDETDFNALIDDLVDALTDSLDRTGKGKITAHIDFDETTVTSPDANVGRLYAKDVGGVTSLFFKDNAGTDTNLLLTSPGLAYTLSTTTTMADPGSGYIRFNHATLSSVTEIAIDDNDANGSDLSAYVLTWDDVGTTNRGTLILQNRTSPGNVVIFTISGASTDNSGWTQLAVTYVTHAGSFGANAPLGVTFSRPGATGDAGAAGSVGPNTGLDYAWATATSGDPGSGKVLANNATLSSATAINISKTGRNSESLGAVLATWDDSTSTVKGHLRIFTVADRTEYIEASISSITDNSTYYTVAISVVAANGSPSANDVMSVVFSRTGDKGADGAGTGDVTGQASSVDNEIALFSGTGGKTIKRATTTGVLKAASGVIAAAAAGTDYVAPGGALGTPSSGTLTNCTGLPAAGLVTSTTQAVGFGSVELGHASDTTLSRSAAGRLAVEGKDALLKGQTDTLTAGYSATAFNAGTKSSGTYTPAASDGNLQYATNGGAHTLAPPSTDTTIIVQYTNNGSAGTITTSGFTRVTGSFTTVNGDDFACYISRVNGFSHLHIQALQ